MASVGAPRSAGPASSARLLERLTARADPSGFVPYDRYMDVALYDPEVGYYAGDRSPLGPGGDYYTAGHVSPLFAAMLARRIARGLAALPPGPPPVVFEVGPGDGSIAAGVIPALARSAGIGPIEYRLIERSEPRAREAYARARSAAEGTAVHVRRAESIGADGPLRGVGFANELLDALPARRIRSAGGRWRELGVRIEGGRLLSAETAPEKSDVVPPLPTGLADGIVMEFSPAAEGWIREVADHLTEGELILIDYGMSEAELIRAHPTGTLEALRGHRFVDDPLASPGEIDLSCFVNFDRVRTVAASAGWTEVAFRAQSEALGAWGFPAVFEEAIAAAGSAEAGVRIRLAVKSLLFGFDRFRVLELATRPRPGAGSGGRE